MPATRKRAKQTQSLREQLLTSADKASERAQRMPPGKARDMLLRRAMQDEGIFGLTNWLNAPGYRRSAE